MTSTPAKAEIREAMRRQRASLDALWVKTTSLRLAERVVALPEFKRASVMCCYLSLPGEVDTELIVGTAWKAGKQVSIPARRDDGEYMPAWFTPDEPMTGGRFGLAEPLTPHWAKPDQFDLFIIPGVAFSTTGGRLGHGRGYYDRMLSRLAARVGCRAGVCFASQLVADLPVAGHDVPMDLVVTEDSVYRIT